MNDMSSSKAVSINNLSYHFLNKASSDPDTSKDILFKNLSFQIPVGQVTAVIGPSGTGKTTLLKLLGGLSQVQAGQIIYPENKVLEKQSIWQPRDLNVSFVYQDYALFPHLTVLENIALSLLGKSLPEMLTKAQEVLEILELNDLCHRKIHQISGGQKQRVALARSLFCQSQFLLWDEPFAALDPKTKNRIVSRLVERIKSNQQTLVFVTHDYRDLLKIADHVVHIQDQGLEFAGPVSQYKTYFLNQVF